MSSASILSSVSEGTRLVQRWYAQVPSEEARPLDAIRKLRGLLFEHGLLEIQP